MTLFYVDLYGGYCGLLAARTLRSAEKIAREENGTNNLKLVRYATERDVAHISMMGGWVPRGRVRKS